MTRVGDLHYGTVFARNCAADVLWMLVRPCTAIEGEAQNGYKALCVQLSTGDTAVWLASGVEVTPYFKAKFSSQ